MSTTTRKQRSSAIRTSTSRAGNSADASDLNDSVGSRSVLESTRTDEKDHLGHLNGRLATYIDKVRQLEAENSHLTVQIRDIEEVEKREKNNLSTQFENEKNRLRRQLEDARAEAAKLLIEKDTAVAEHDRLSAKVGKLERDLKKAEADRLSALSLAESSTAKQNTMQNKLDKVEAENRELEKENARIRAQLATLQKNLEDESVMRAAANNKLQSVQEDLEFQKRQHHTAMEEVRHKRQVEMTTYAKQVTEDHQNQLQDKLEEMRAQFQQQLAANKQSFEENYKNKLNDARDSAEKAKAEASRYRSRVVELETSGSGNEALIETLRRQLKDEKDSNAAKLRGYQDRLEDKDARIDELNKEIQRNLEEYHNLLDLKVELDTELKAYQAMLESEETRLNITGDQSRNNSTVSHHVSFTSGTGSAQRGVKRRRVDLDQSTTFDRTQLQKETTGPVGIDEVDEEGEWVRIINNSDEEVPIGQWKLIVTAGGKEVAYQFSTRMKLESGASATVYSSDSKEAKEKSHPAGSIVMKKQTWPTGANPSARLEDNEGDTVSTITVEETHSGDAADPAERCSIM